MASLSSLLCLLAVAGIAIMTAEGRSWRGNNAWIDAGNGFMYRITPKKVSWHAARYWCKGIGGDLATTGMRENYWTRVAVANTMLLRDEFTWIGLNDLKYEGHWMWVDGVRATTSNAFWYKGEPNNSHNEDCGGINLNRDFKTNDAPCGHQHFGLCEAKIKH